MHVPATLNAQRSVKILVVAETMKLANCEIKKLKEEWKKKIIHDIERIKKNRPREYWKKLKQFSKGKKKTTTWDTAVDESGVEVAGEKIKLVWKEAYRKLGSEEIMEDGFDEKYAEEVREEIIDMEKRSLT